MPCPGHAADEAAVLRIRAAQLAGEGRCQEALPLLERARERAPDDAGAALLQGQCLFEEKRYRDAVAPLEDALRLDPNLGEAALVLGMAYYHDGDPVRAQRELKRAEKLLPERAELALYLGLVLLEEAQSEEAAARFDRAGRLDPAVAQPAASYFEGIAWASAGRREEAEQALTRVGELAPGSEWSTRADAALESMQEGGRLRRWAVVRGGIDYDSNVSLRGQDVALPADVSGESDGRGWWGVDAGTELFRKGEWGGGALVSYFGSRYFELTEFDQQFVTTSLWVDRRMGETTTLRLKPEFGASFLDYDDYLRFYGTTFEVFQDWGRAGGGRFGVRYAYNDYLYRIPGTPDLRRERNRDGHSIFTGYEHSIPVGPTTALRGGPYYLHYDSKGREFRQDLFGGMLGIHQALPARFALDVEGSYAGAHYAGPSSYLQPGERIRDRRDLIGIVEVRLERPITDRISATARWLYYNSDSNTNVFAYDRHIAGAWLTIGFGG